VEVARESWPDDAPASLRVVTEPRLGLSFARSAGVEAARYELVCFVDDDNWVGADWVETVAEVMRAQPTVGACGGRSEAVFEGEPPHWFARYQASYAVGTQGDGPGDVTETRGLLWGAGLTVRKSAWRGLQEEGFTFRAPDRQGAALTSGGDSELCLALRLRGWRLWYDPRLRLQHYLPANRLTWSYLRRLHYAAAFSAVSQDEYYFQLLPFGKGLRGRLRRRWEWQAMRTAGMLLRHPVKAVRARRELCEGDAGVLQVESVLGRLAALVAARGS
jgi:cellulose synthase/poly-beta-1,6-N-acetylglucosamine synthase-like glycosyltransferase